MPRHQATPIRRAPGCLWAKAGCHLGTLGSWHGRVAAVARAQQVDRAPRIGVLMNRAATVGQLSSSILILLPPCLFAFSKLGVPSGQ